MEFQESNFPGVKITRGKIKRGFFFPGLGIHVPQNASIAYIQHEYGHFLQFKEFGFLKYLDISAKSIKSAISNTNYNHLRTYVELDATTKAHNFFAEKSMLNNESWPTFYNYKIK